MLKENFYDRKQYLDILNKRVSDLKFGYRQNIAIVGDELIGKSSILFKFLNKFYDNRIILLYIETRFETLDAFVKRFIGSLLYNFMLNSNLPLKEDLDFLIKKSERYAPKTVSKIRCILNNLEKRKRNDILTETMSLCEIINEETGKFCVVILDEFHNLENLGIKNLYREWSKILITQKNTMHLITSSMKFKAKNILSKNLSLLFGNFELMTVEPFNIKTSEEYLSLKAPSLNSGLKKFIIHFTGGWPFYLNLISDAIQKTKQASLTEILENILFEPTGILNQRFSNYLKRFTDNNRGNEYLPILHLISNGNNRLKDIAHALHKTQKEINLRINRLVELDTITRSADFLNINDRVLGFWLKFVYQGKSNSLTFDAKNQKLFFRDNIEKMIQNFLSETNRPISERISEVLRLFQDDLFQFEKKKVKLSHFREIKPLEFANKRIKEGILGRSQDSLWILAVKPEGLIEEDIVDFAKECKKYRNKLQKKIIVTFQDVDANSRLRALEEKIWMWDINNLNNILDLFSKPRIIA